MRSFYEPHHNRLNKQVDDIINNNNDFIDKIIQITKNNNSFYNFSQNNFYVNLQNDLAELKFTVDDNNELYKTLCEDIDKEDIKIEDLFENFFVVHELMVRNLCKYTFFRISNFFKDIKKKPESHHS